MENASKALLMAGGILLGILILTLMVTLFSSGRELGFQYEETKKSEAIQQFNVNFTKYLGQDLTIHQVVSICNFAKKSNNKIKEVTITGNEYTQENIKEAVENYTNDGDSIPKYTITILHSNDGYVNSISFTEK